MKQILITVFSTFLIGLTSFGQSKFSNEKIVWTDFEWADESSKDVMLITSQLDGLDYLFRWQLDTGSPYTYMEGGTFKKFTTKFPYLAEKIKRVDTVYNGNWYKIFTPPFKFDKPILPNVILKMIKSVAIFRRTCLTNTKVLVSAQSALTFLKTEY